MSWVVATVAVTFVAIAVVWLSNLSKGFVSRIIESPAGSVSLATDERSLLELMTPDKIAAPRVVTSDGLQGVVSIPNGTKGRVVDRKIYRDGRLIDPYPTSRNEMERDGAVELERIRITEGPHKGVEGWVLSSVLRRTMVFP